MNFHEGEYLYINKPYGMSSFGALAHIRYVVSKRLGVKRVKMGHAGTLDPLATGVLILCTGKKTKEIETLQLHTKEYIAGVQFGCTTASYDREHTVDHTYPKNHITRQLLEEALRRFEGDIMQTPPIYSAIKINGTRAYKHGRAGTEVVISPKPVHIDEIELLEFDDVRKWARIRVVCGKGTYIRSLGRD
ncbi:MAG: tRNA pseudouridine(55) synthase TruB, partial [Prevotella sp.]|nr:tRNA pseudouridine(55) synthase TruB [Prevotella sp.]